MRFLPARTAQFNQRLEITLLDNGIDIKILYFNVVTHYRIVYRFYEMEKYCRHGYEPRKTVWVYNIQNLGNKQWTGRLVHRT